MAEQSIIEQIHKLCGIMDISEQVDDYFKRVLTLSRLATAQ